MRYREVQQAFFLPAGSAAFVPFGLRRLRQLRSQFERHAIFRDAVNRMQQFSHRGKESEFCGLSCGTQAFIECAKPGVAANSSKHRHPKRHAQPRISKRSSTCPNTRSFAGLFYTRNDTGIGRKSRRASKPCRIAHSPNHTGGGLRPNPVDGCQKLTDFMPIDQSLDFAFEFGQPPSPKVEVLTDMRRL